MPGTVASCWMGIYMMQRVACGPAQTLDGVGGLEAVGEQETKGAPHEGRESWWAEGSVGLLLFCAAPLSRRLGCGNGVNISCGFLARYTYAPLLDVLVEVMCLRVVQEIRGVTRMRRINGNILVHKLSIFLHSRVKIASRKRRNRCCWCRVTSKRRSVSMR